MLIDSLPSHNINLKVSLGI